MSNPISRTLTYEDDLQERRIIGQEDIAAIVEPVVILGDPGQGKSVLAQTLGDELGMKYCRAGKFERAARPETLIAESERIIVDGLDEIASSSPGGAVDSVLRQLSKMGSPPFTLTCREADWRGAADRVRIEDDYGATPVLLHLQPFSYDDACTFLSNEFPAVDDAVILDHLQDRRLDAFYQNPLTLRLFGEVAQQTGALPERRVELLDRACSVMLREENPRHQDNSHVHRSLEDLLLASGALCATQVLCARSAIYTGAYPDTPDDCVHVDEISRLPFGEPAADALRTRLFQAEDERRFTHIHRIIAEYLGAKWLAACFDAGCSEQRIFSLFRSGDGVPTSLRGLHAWMAHFNAGLASRCIATDPYAIMRYGDAETIDLDQARTLLTALTNLSETDPHFATEDWGRHLAPGLMRPELSDPVLSLIAAPDRNLQLSILLLRTMVGTALAEELGETLSEIMLDTTRRYAERAAATDAIHVATPPADWEAVIHWLLAAGDGDSTRLACTILNFAGANAVSLETSVSTILGHLGFTENHMPAADVPVVRHVDNSLFLDLDTTSLARLLDMIADRARPFMGRADFSAMRQITTLVRRLTLRVLEADLSTLPERVWAWLEWLDGRRPYNNVERERLTELFRTERALRAALLEHVLLTPCADNTWLAAHRLYETQLGLKPTDEDLVGLLRALRARASDHLIDTVMWSDLLRLGRTAKGIADIVRNAAIESADGNPELLGILDQMCRVVEPERSAEQARFEALDEEEARRQELFQPHRDRHMERVPEIAAGNVLDLAYAADVYLGRCIDFDDSASPVTRLHELLGDPLTEQALTGFGAVLGRNDLPTAENIANSRTEQRYYFAEAPMICGIAEMLRQGIPIVTVDRAALAAIYMAWQRAPESGIDSPIDIGPAVEEVLFRDERDAEAHFRTSIEPQLSCRVEHLYELYGLTHDARWAPLSGRLAAEWLHRFRELPLPVATELVSCAVKSAPQEMLNDLLAGWTIDAVPDRDTMLLWLSAAFVVEFDRRRNDLAETENAGAIIPH